jgi:hypothetical protein
MVEAQRVAALEEMENAREKPVEISEPIPANSLGGALRNC